MKLVLATQDPWRTTRLHLVKRTLEKRFQVEVLHPVMVTKRRVMGRYFSAGIRYLGYNLQELIADADVLHLFSSPDFIHLASLMKRVAVCYDYRSNFAEKLREESAVLGSFAWAAEAALLGRASIVLTVNTILQDRLKRVSRKPIYVVPNYPSRSFRSAVRSLEEVLAGQGLEKPLALFTGGLTKTYDFAAIILAARSLPHVTFAIAGEGPLRRSMEALAPPNVRFLGWVAHERIPDLIAASDVCLAPIRRYSATVPANDQDVWKISEYAALSKPIVATGIAPSTQYCLARSREEFAGLIHAALDGRVPSSTPRFWEDYCEPVLLEAYERLATVS